MCQNDIFYEWTDENAFTETRLGDQDQCIFFKLFQRYCPGL